MRRMLALALAMLLVFAAGCTPVPSQQEQGTRFYYCVSGDAHTGPAIAYELDQLEELTVDTLLQRLFHGPDQITLTNTFPTGTHLLGWSMEGEVLIVDLSEEFGGLTGIALRKAIYCVVLTLCQMDGIEKVAITVGGRSLPGTGTGVLTVDDVELKGEIQDPVTISSQLYFPLADMSGLGLEYRAFEVADDSVLAQANGVLEQLKQGPREAEMTSFLAQAGTINAVGIENEVCIVALDGSTLSALYEDQEIVLLYLYAIVDSLTELNGIGAVRFMIEQIAVPGLEDSYGAVYEF